jgi:formylglycine-generating enzyme required for sulfatase activity
MQAWFTRRGLNRMRYGTRVLSGGVVFCIALASSSDAATPRKAAAAVRDCAHCPEMVAIAAGRFLMGTAADDPLHDALEAPRHQVTVRRFLAGKYDVTRSEWAYFVRSTGRPTVKGCQWTGKVGPDGDKSASWDDLGFEQTDRDPVVCVTWQDAKDYAKWLSRKTGKHYRLLSEAEWEYAARAGTATPYFWGAGASHEHANHGAEECCGGLVSGRDQWIKTSPGDAFDPNGFGLFDMSGNVLQWVEDCFSPSYAGLPANGAPFKTARPIVATGDLKELSGTWTCSYRVVRGGDWGDQALWIRTASRSFAPPPGPGPALSDYRSGGVGFRVARDWR